MPDKSQVIEEVFGLANPKIDESRRQDITTLLQSTINGDTIADYLVINASVKKDVMGALVYVLTNKRIIKFEIDPNEIKSVSFLLDTINGFERTIEGTREGVKVTFATGSFGLQYTMPNKKISEFFQKVDQARITKGSGSTP